jgi:hypothetical protein
MIYDDFANQHPLLKAIKKLSKSVDKQAKIKGIQTEEDVVAFTKQVRRELAQEKLTQNVT